ncbi:hypothetical protein WG66_004621 [Moniliophthora roreri]|nr:hypothetical protein WG66_004621 [Moniliophthora roreri]
MPISSPFLFRHHPHVGPPNINITNIYQKALLDIKPPSSHTLCPAIPVSLSRIIAGMPVKRSVYTVASSILVLRPWDGKVALGWISMSGMSNTSDWNTPNNFVSGPSPYYSNMCHATSRNLIQITQYNDCDAVPVPTPMSFGFAVTSIFIGLVSRESSHRGQSGWIKRCMP